MPKYETKDIRNLTLVGHGDSGKTSISELMLFKAGAVARQGKVEDGTSVLDSDPEEKSRKISIDLGVAHFTWKGKEVNLLDAPGYPDFAGEGIAAMAGVETAVLCIHAANGVMVNTRKMWEQATKRGLARAILVNKMDGENVDWAKALGQIQETFGQNCLPVFLPIGQAHSFKGVASVLDPPAPAPAGLLGDLKAAHDKVVEAVVEVDDKLMERYLEAGEITKEERDKAFPQAIARGRLVPILCASARQGGGVEEVMDFLVRFFPSPLEMPPKKGTHPKSKEEVGLDRAPDSPFSAHVFKSTRDQHVGKLTLFRVHSGSLAAETSIYNVRTDKTERIGKLFKLIGREQKLIDKAIPGDIVALTKVEDIAVGDTLATAAAPLLYPAIGWPIPMVSAALEPKNRNDEQKLSQGIGYLADSDPTLVISRDKQTGEVIANGMSKLHLDISLLRLKARYGVEVTTKPPKIPYKETITAKAETSYRHKKQTGGSGQFAEVHLRCWPLERGSGFEFVNEVFGGAISQQYIPSVEKGVRAICDQGVIAGYPVVDIHVEVFDGKEHPVDSKDIAFQIAARECFRELVQKARPALIEPIVTLEVTIPSDKMGAITGDLNSRRGRIQGMDSNGNMQVVRAQVPLSEVMNYATELRSITGGEGYYSVEFSHYDQVPARNQEMIVQKSKAEQAAKAHPEE